MVASAITSKDQKFNLGIQPDEIKEIKTHIVSIFNIGFSMVAVFAAAYKASQTMIDDYGWVKQAHDNIIVLIFIILANINRLKRCGYYWYR